MRYWYIVLILFFSACSDPFESGRPDVDAGTQDGGADAGAIDAGID